MSKSHSSKRRPPESLKQAAASSDTHMQEQVVDINSELAQMNVGLVSHTSSAYWHC